MSVIKSRKVNTVSTTPVPNEEHRAQRVLFETNPIETIDHQHLAFETPSQDYVYLGATSNIVVPSTTCCAYSITLEDSGLPDQSKYLKVSLPENMYLDMVRITLNAEVSFVSVRIVPFESIQRGWQMENMENTFRFYQTMDAQNIYLGLTANKEFIGGFSINDPTIMFGLVLLSS